LDSAGEDSISQGDMLLQINTSYNEERMLGIQSIRGDLKVLFFVFLVSTLQWQLRTFRTSVLPVDAERDV